MCGVRVRARVVVALLGLTGGVEAAEVSSDCVRLTGAARDELEARARLTLHAAAAHADVPASVIVRCDEGGAWLDWRGEQTERLAVYEGAGLLEGALRAIERRLESGPSSRPRRDTGGISSPPEGAALPEPTFPEPRGSARRDTSTTRLSTGGLALALRAGPGPVAAGPELALGVGTRGFALSSSESLLFGAAFTLLGLRFGAGYGAPYTRGRWFGVHAFAGWQGLAGTGPHASANVRTTALSGIMGGALRGSRRVGPGLVYAGLDLTYRLRRLVIDPSFGVALPRWQPEVVLGWAFVP